MAMPFQNRHSMHERTAALDVDGVLLDFLGGYEAVGAHVLGRQLVRRNNAYSLDLRYGLTVAEDQAIRKGLETHAMGWAGLPALAGAVEAFVALQRLGFSIHLVTAIDVQWRDARLENLRRLGLTPDSIDCVGATQVSKAQALARLNPVMFVDDRLHLLHDAPFVPNRVWVDTGDDQEGQVVTEDIVQVTSLHQWVKAWAQSQNRPMPVVNPMPEARANVLPFRAPTLSHRR